MVITSTFSGPMLRQFLKDQEVDHLEIIGLDDKGIEDDKVYIMDGVQQSTQKVRVSIVEHIDNLEDLRRSWRPIAEIEETRQEWRPIVEIEEGKIK